MRTSRPCAKARSGCRQSPWRRLRKWPTRSCAAGRVRNSGRAVGQRARVRGDDVTGAPHRPDDDRMAWIVLDLLTKLGDQDVDAAIEWRPSALQHGVHQFLARLHLARVLDEMGE